MARVRVSLLHRPRTWARCPACR